jgi:hypothetical protein
MTHAPSPLDKRVCVERRDHNSRRLHFNRVGDWRPRLIVWPEYNRLPKDEFEETFGEPVDDSTDEAWGHIVGETLDRFAGEFGHRVTAFELVLPTFWQRLCSPYAAPCWKRNDAFRLDAAYVNSRQHFGHDSPVFLICATQATASVPKEIGGAVLDRANLLPFGVAIFDLGIEEAVLEISFAEHEDTFLQILERVARERSYQMLQTDKHFVSHWVVANKETFGPDCDKF